MSEDLTGKLVIDLIINGKFVALVMDDGEASYLPQDEAEVDEDDILIAAKMAEDALLERGAWLGGVAAIRSCRWLRRRPSVNGQSGCGACRLFAAHLCLAFSWG